MEDQEWVAVAEDRKQLMEQVAEAVDRRGEVGEEGDSFLPILYLKSKSSCQIFNPYSMEKLSSDLIVCLLDFFESHDTSILSTISRSFSDVFHNNAAFIFRRYFKRDARDYYPDRADDRLDGSDSLDDYRVSYRLRHYHQVVPFNDAPARLVHRLRLL